MSRNLILAAAFAALAAPAFAQATDGPGPNLTIEVAGAANGTVVIDLLPDLAPQHVAQIVALAKEGAYDNVVFHRVIDGFMAQTGDPTGTGQGGSQLPDLKAEFNYMPHVRGTVSMARTDQPDTANSQFFIVFYPRFALDNRYTNFGRVIAGMDVVDTIERGEPPVNPTKILQASLLSENKPRPVISAPVAAPDMLAPGATAPGSTGK